MLESTIVDSNVATSNIVHQISKLSTNNLSNSPSAELISFPVVHTDSDIQETIPCKELSAEVWLRIFNELDRNDLDHCEYVCVRWRHIIRNNKKHLPGREIDYIIISSKRVYSMILSSGNLIKTYQFRKYYDDRNVQLPVNDKSHMLITAYRRKTARRPGECRTFNSYIQELREMVGETAFRHWPNTLSIAQQLHNHKMSDDFYGKPGRDPYDLRYPPRYVKTKYKLGSPPALFFEKLNDLLRNHRSVRYWVFQTFTFTDSFAYKFMLHVRPINLIRETVILRRIKRSKIDERALIFFLRVLLDDGSAENKWSQLPPIPTGSD